MSSSDEIDRQLEKQAQVVLSEINNERGNPSKSSPDDGCVSCSVLLGAVVIWFIYILAIAPRWKSDTQELPNNCDILSELIQIYPRGWTETRIERMHGDNIDIFISRKDFESIPYPDRKETITRIGKSWRDFSSWYFFPSVRIRDVRTGEILADYSCTFNSSSLHDSHWW